MSGIIFRVFILIMFAVANGILSWIVYRQLTGPDVVEKLPQIGLNLAVIVFVSAEAIRVVRQIKSIMDDGNEVLCDK